MARTRHGAAVGSAPGNRPSALGAERRQAQAPGDAAAMRASATATSAATPTTDDHVLSWWPIIRHIVGGD